MHSTEIRRPCNHPLHLVLTVLTCGMWTPFWIGAAVIGRRERVTVYAPPAHFAVDPVTGRWVQRYAPPEGLPPRPSSRP